MLEKIIILILCHLIGDYVLQSDLIVKTKQIVSVTSDTTEIVHNAIMNTRNK
jgi:hypothetical protein